MRSSFLLLSIFFAFIVRVTSFGFPATPEGLTREAILSMIHKRYPKSNVSPSNDNDNGGAPNNQFPLHGKVAVVTGAAGGIGRELSKLIYQFGGTVVALDRNAIGLNELEHHLLSNNNHLDPQSQRIWTLETHHEDLSSVSRSADRILSRFDRVDLLINNAGLTYRPDALPGSPATRSAHGMDLSFTVNYLSHFLLTEKLLPLLSSADEGGRVVHLTSTYHWKVDGTELIPPPRATATSSSSREGPPAYQSDPSKQSRQHVPRAYANSKLAQLWHSRSLRIPNGTSVCACPTWAATGIGGDDARSFLQRHAFGVDDCGPGVTSAVNAMFRTEEELGGAANDGREFVANSRVLEWIPGKRHLLAGELVTKVLGWRDGVTDLLGLVLLFGQRFGYEDFIIQETSPESFGKEEERRLFYDWSLEEVKDYL